MERSNTYHAFFIFNVNSTKNIGRIGVKLLLCSHFMQEIPYMWYINAEY